ncbi:MAG: PQQ-dependent sugar dehydrogenase, partial [Saprospiraceae bacterium]
MRVIILVALLFLIIPLSGQLPNGFVRELIVTDLNPTSLAQAKDGRIFIVEKHGVIRVVRDNQVLDEPLLTIEVNDANEKGLGHMVLHPDFEDNGYFYIYFSVPDSRFNRVSRWTANGDKAIPGSEKIILDMDETGADIHNGGAMVFGHDGHLYISSGDGSQSSVGEDPGSTNAKILRVTEAGEPVSDNPYYNLNLGRSNLVYASGLRNPFTMTIHPVNGKIYANDVGESTWEEINRIEKGAFYGWPRIEGKQNGEDLPSEYLDPVYQYHHSNEYCAVVGSAFYLPEIQQFPQEYIGRYFYSDYCTGHIRMLNAESGQDFGIFMTDGDRVVDLLVNNEGSLYYLERRGLGDASHEDNGSTTNGNLWKISYTGVGTPFISIQPKSILVVDGEDATFNVSATGSFPLTYRWSVDDVEMITENIPSFTMNNVST